MTTENEDQQDQADEQADEEQGTEEEQAADDGPVDAALVARLRKEAAERRVTAKADKAALEAARGRVLALEVKDAARGILADPSDLLAHVAAADLLDDDGEPDAEKIAAAARALVAKKAHLASRTPAGDVDQGARGKPAEVFDFAALLRGAAG